MSPLGYCSTLLAGWLLLFPLSPVLKIPYRSISLKEANVFTLAYKVLHDFMFCYLSVLIYYFFSLSLCSNHIYLFLFLEHNTPDILCLWTSHMLLSACNAIPVATHTTLHCFFQISIPHPRYQTAFPKYCVN